MPAYFHRCKRCTHEYDIWSPTMQEYEAVCKKAKCEECGSKSKERIFTACNFNFSNPVGTDRWNSDSKGHDYRFKHNAPNLRAQRSAAETASHMGTQPYNAIDDISSGKNFGKVK